MDIQDTHPLASEITAYLAETGMKPTQLGDRALNDPNFVSDLINKAREPRRATVARVRRFMAENPPPLPETAPNAAR